MIEELPKFSFEGQQLTAENSYQYGPVCVDQDYRSSGIFEKVFFASLASMRDRYPIMATFINQINSRSYAVHTRKAGMAEGGRFDYDNSHYYLMACSANV